MDIGLECNVSDLNKDLEPKCPLQGFKSTSLYMTVFDLQFYLCHKTLDPDVATCLAPEPDSGFSESGYKNC
jgi:hypothetical protein